MSAPHFPRDEERTDEADSVERPELLASPESAEAPSGHALGDQNRGTLLAFGIVSGVVLLFVIIGAILRAVN